MFTGGNIRPSAGAQPAGKAHPELDPSKPASNSGPDAGAGGDGFEHYQIDGNESGATCTHTTADGQTEQSDHASVEEALATAGGGAASPDQSAGAAPTDDQGPDFSAAYSK